MGASHETLRPPHPQSWVPEARHLAVQERAEMESGREDWPPWSTKEVSVATG